MFWEEDSIEYEIFNHYEYALSAVGVDFEREDVQAALEGCSFGKLVPTQKSKDAKLHLCAFAYLRLPCGIS